MGAGGSLRLGPWLWEGSLPLPLGLRRDHGPATSWRRVGSHHVRRELGVSPLAASLMGLATRWLSGGYGAHADLPFYR